MSATNSSSATTTTTTTAINAAPAVHRPDPARVARAIAKRSFATVATVSQSGHPHVAGVLYEEVDGRLYVSTLVSSRKARNIAANHRVGVCIPIRRLPVGPPSTVQFQAVADVLATDDPGISGLVADGRLASITGHGELELADGCFLRIDVPERLLTYGLGMPLWTLIRDPLGCGGVVDPGSMP